MQYLLLLTRKATNCGYSWILLLLLHLYFPKVASYFWKFHLANLMLAPWSSKLTVALLQLCLHRISTYHHTYWPSSYSFPAKLPSLGLTHISFNPVIWKQIHMYKVSLCRHFWKGSFPHMEKCWSQPALPRCRNPSLMEILLHQWSACSSLLWGWQTFSIQKYM